MTEFYFVAGAFVLFVCVFVYACALSSWPATFHPSARRRTAEQQVEAVETWHVHHTLPLSPVLSRARGYLKVRDFVGVESAYREARRVVDKDVQSC
jgi:hypothetical protein